RTPATAARCPSACWWPTGRCHSIADPRSGRKAIAWTISNNATKGIPMVIMDERIRKLMGLHSTGPCKQLRQYAKRAAPGAWGYSGGERVPRYRGMGGNAAHIIPQSKGAQNRLVPRPFLSFLKVPTVGRRRSAIEDKFATRQLVPERKAPPKRGVSGDGSRPLNLSSVKDADRQPLVTTGAGGGYLPIGALPTGHLPTGGGAGGGGSLRGRSAAAAALSIAKDAASAVRIFSMM